VVHTVLFVFCEINERMNGNPDNGPDNQDGGTDRLREPFYAWRLFTTKTGEWNKRYSRRNIGIII